MTTYDYIKAFIILLFTFLIYLKVARKPIFVVKSVITGALHIFIITSLSIGLINIVSEPYTSTIYIIISSFVFAIAYKANIIESISFTAISFIFSYILFIISSAISGFIFAILNSDNYRSILSILIIAIIQVILFGFISKVKFRIILKKSVCITGLSITFLILIMYSIFRDENLAHRSYGFLIIGSVLCAIGLFYWIKRESITAYNNKIQAMENEKLKEEVERAKEDRQYYEKIVHNDGKKLPAYQEAVESLIESVNDPTAKQKAERILSELDDARSAVTSNVVREMARVKVLPSTSLELLDAIFTHYQRICMDKEIDFDLIVRRTPNIIKQSDLETLAANLIDNAIIACEHKSNSQGSIVVNLSNGGLSVMDNGIAFERETLELLGKERITTHADSGGSGLGFMTIFEIVRSCKASVIITQTGEYKTVAVRFDSEANYRVESQGERINLLQ